MDALGPVVRRVVPQLPVDSHPPPDGAGLRLRRARPPIRHAGVASRLPRLTALALGFSLAGSALSAQETADSTADGRSVTGETLRRAGATRLGDVLRLAGMWDVATVDGFTWQASPLGGGPFAPAGWRVMVDGRRMELDLFGTTSLDRLGIPLDLIERVELVELPRLAAGRL